MEAIIPLLRNSDSGMTYKICVSKEVKLCSTNTRKPRLLKFLSWKRCGELLELGRALKGGSGGKEGKELRNCKDKFHLNLIPSLQKSILNIYYVRGARPNLLLVLNMVSIW